MKRKVRCRLSLAAWVLTISVAYLVLAVLDAPLAEAWAIAFVGLLLGPTVAVETREYVRND